MSGNCGPSKAALDLDKKIGGAMDTVKDSFIGSAAGGIADGIAGLKDSLTGLTDGIVAEIENAIPEIPAPKANLQDQMNKVIDSLDDPGALLSEIESINLNFGDKINVDDMLSKAGLDPSKLNELSTQFNDLKNKADPSKIGALADLAGGDLSAIKDLMGPLPSISLPGFDAASIKEGICTGVPNLDLDAAGEIVKKGIPTKAPSEDGEKVEPAEKAPEPVVPAKDPTPSDKIENGQTIILNPDGEKAKEIEQKYIEDLEQVRPIALKIALREIELYENRQEIRDLTGFFTTSKKNKEKQRELTLRNIQIARRNTKDALYIELLEKDIEYDRDKAFFDNELILKEPRKPEITYEEIHERTYFSNYPETITKIEALPNLIIKGEKQERVDFSKKS